MSALPRIGAFVVLAVVASFAFVLSFTALSDLAAHNAVRPSQAWMIPVVVDATIIGATLAVVAAPRRRWFPWTILAVAASLSVAGNMAHAWSFGPIAIVIAAVPPVFLLAMTELAVVLSRPRYSAEPTVSPQSVLSAAVTAVPESYLHETCKPMPLFPVSDHQSKVPDLAQKWRAARNVA